ALEALINFAYNGHLAIDQQNTRPRCCTSIAGLIYAIYVCGGYDGTSSLNSVEAYSPETDKWTVGTPMSSNRSAAGVTVFEGRIFVFSQPHGSCSRQTWLFCDPPPGDVEIQQTGGRV
ncbi:hypothetical protein E2320_001433, partial [Naja naja]